MTQYVIRRLLLAVPTLLGVSLLVFLIVRALPGDVVEAIIGQYTPISETDSAHSSSLAHADALIIQPEDDSGQRAGDIVEVIPLSMLG